MDMHSGMELSATSNTFGNQRYPPNPRSTKDETQKGKTALGNNVQRAHKFKPTTCEICGRSLHSDSNYNVQRASAHSGRWPVRCSFPGCTDDQSFATSISYSGYLTKTHGLKNGEDRAPFMPPSTKKWKPQVCVVPACNFATVFLTKHQMQGHMRFGHKMGQEDMDRSLDRDTVYVRKRKYPCDQEQPRIDL